MQYIELGERRIEANEEGFVADPRTWTRELAEQMARKDPDGPAKQACRYAGLPKPTGCI